MTDIDRFVLGLDKDGEVLPSGVELYLMGLGDGVRRAQLLRGICSVGTFPAPPVAVHPDTHTLDLLASYVSSWGAQCST